METAAGREKGMTTAAHPFTGHQIPPDVRARLLDRDTVANAYAHHSIKAAGKTIGAGQVTFQNALDWHGIPRRKRGVKPPGTVITREAVAAAAARAYARVGRCPPGCKGS